jgi:DNA polymerase-1
MKPVVVDLETTHLSGDVILGYGVCDESGSFTLPWSQSAKETLQGILNSQMCIFHNAAFDVSVLRKHGLSVPTGYHDTMIMAFILNPSLPGYSLESLCKHYELQQKLEQPTDWSVWTYEMALYCEGDVQSTWHLYYKLLELYTQYPKAWHLYDTVERPFIEVIIEMEATGFVIDRKLLARLSTHLKRKKSRLSEKLRQLAGLQQGEEKLYSRKVPLFPDNPESESVGYHTHKGITTFDHCKVTEFNPQSNNHIVSVLTRLGWVPEKFTPSGSPQCDQDVITPLGDKYPFARVLQSLNTITTINDTFLEPIGELTDSNDVLRASFNQTGARTGRLSSSSPNLQNIPSRGEWGKSVRALMTVPNDDWRLVAIDLN